MWMYKLKSWFLPFGNGIIYQRRQDAGRMRASLSSVFSRIISLALDLVSFCLTGTGPNTLFHSIGLLTWPTSLCEDRSQSSACSSLPTSTPLFTDSGKFGSTWWFLTFSFFATSFLSIKSSDDAVEPSLCLLLFLLSSPLKSIAAALVHPRATSATPLLLLLLLLLPPLLLPWPNLVKQMQLSPFSLALSFDGPANQIQEAIHPAVVNQMVHFSRSSCIRYFFFLPLFTKFKLLVLALLLQLLLSLYSPPPLLLLLLFWCS